MTTATNKKPITVAAPTLTGGVTGVHFQPSRFDTLIEQHGYNVYLDKALWCPCRITALADSAQSDCKNCGGTGFIFYNREKTKAILTSTSLSLPLKQWSQDIKGTVSFTLRESDQVQEMDRIIVLDTVSIFSEKLQIKIDETGKELNSYTIYNIVNILDLFLFIKSDTKLKRLQLNSDYVFCDNRITLSNEYLNKKPSSLSVSIRYKHHPQFHVIDLNREVISAPVVFDKNSAQNTSTSTTKLRPQQLPVHGIARRAHYIFDLENKQHNRIFDNSYLGTDQDCGCNKINPLNITEPNSITINIKDNPTSAKITLFNGQQINQDYLSGKSFTIPHLIGLNVNMPIFIDGKVYQNTIGFNSKNGEFTYLQRGNFLNNSIITIMYNEKSNLVKRKCTITVQIVASPNGSLYTLCNKEQIAAQYPAGNILTIPYLIGKRVIQPIFIDGRVNQKITFNPTGGTFDGTIRKGFQIGNEITIEYVEV